MRELKRHLVAQMHHLGVQADGKLMDEGDAVRSRDVDGADLAFRQSVDGRIERLVDAEAAGKEVHRARREHGKRDLPVHQNGSGGRYRAVPAGRDDHVDGFARRRLLQRSLHVLACNHLDVDGAADLVDRIGDSVAERVKVVVRSVPPSLFNTHETHESLHWPVTATV